MEVVVLSSCSVRRVADAGAPNTHGGGFEILVTLAPNRLRPSVGLGPLQPGAGPSAALWVAPTLLKR